MKFGQLIEDNMRNHFFEKSYTIISSLKLYVSLFFIVCQVEDSQNILKLSSRAVAFIYLI